MENNRRPIDPLISVIIIVRDEVKNIERCLSQIVRQDYPMDRIEVLIADGESTDDTIAVAKAFPMGEARLRVITGFGLGRSQGLNQAIRESRGDIIARLDARTLIEPDYFKACLETLRASGAANVGGVQKPIARSSTQKAIGIALQNPFGVGDAQFRLGRKSGPVESVYLGFFKREVFDEVGLFDELAPVISEDSDLNHRIRQAGGIIWLNHQIHAYYYPRERIRDLWRLYFRYGGARAGNFLKWKKLSWRQTVPPVFVAVLAGGLLASPFNPAIRWSWLALVAVYLAADLFYSWMAAAGGSREEGERFLPLWGRLLIIFPTMHFAWALGFFRRVTQRLQPGEYWGY